jgi:hypothetical protein
MHNGNPAFPRIGMNHTQSRVYPAHRISPRGVQGGRQTPLFARTPNQTYPYRFSIIPQTLLEAALRLPPPLRRPQHGERDSTGGFMIFLKSPVYPAHRISPAGGSKGGGSPPVSMHNGNPAFPRIGMNQTQIPGLPCPQDIASGGSKGGDSPPVGMHNGNPAFPRIGMNHTQSRVYPAHRISPRGVQGGRQTPLFARTPNQTYPYRFSIIPQTLLEAALRLPPPLRCPQQGDRDYTGGTLNRA